MRVSDDPLVHELDMPPMAYFDIPLDIPGEERQVQRVVAHQMKSGPFKTQQQAENFSKLGVERVRQEILTRGGGVIWWRVRPEVSHERDAWHFYARCGTSPDLPTSFWSEMSDRGR